MEVSRIRFMGKFGSLDVTVIKLKLLLKLFDNDWNSFRLGLRLLSRVKPSEIFLKSITKEVTRVEVIYPSRLVPWWSIHIQ